MNTTYSDNVHNHYYYLLGTSIYYYVDIQYYHYIINMCVMCILKS